MVFLGIVLAGAAVCIAIATIVDNAAPASLSVFGQHVPGVTSEAQVFVAGLITAIFFVIGLAIASLAMGRSVRVRRELRNLREEHEESLATLEMERQQLQRELARARGGRPATGRMPRPAEAPTTGDIPVAGRKARDRDPVSPFFDQSA